MLIIPQNFKKQKTVAFFGEITPLDFFESENFIILQLFWLFLLFRLKVIKLNLILSQKYQRNKIKYFIFSLKHYFTSVFDQVYKVLWLRKLLRFLSFWLSCGWLHSLDITISAKTCSFLSINSLILIMTFKQSQLSWQELSSKLFLRHLK